MTETDHPQLLRLKRIAIDTYQEPVIYMRADCAVCRSEGFEAQSRLRVEVGGRTIIASLNVTHNHLLTHDEAGLSEAAWKLLDPQEGQWVHVSHAPQLESLSHVRAKIYGHRLDDGAAAAITGDIVAGRYADVHLAAFIAACGGDRLNVEEMVSLTKAMVDTGDRLTWPQSPIMDKHCVGGLPGNRTTPIVVAIVAACGLIMPKTSSRAITSPAGTADVMEVMTPVTLDIARMRRVVEKEGACIVWGGSVQLSPADDILIRVERVLDIDSEGQLVASVLSKKIAAGSSHVVIDIPVGPTAKVRTRAAAAQLSQALQSVGTRLNLSLRCVLTDGNQPVGRGIGPALEAADVLAVLQGAAEAPDDLRERAILLAANVLEMSGRAVAGTGDAKAREALANGSAWRKFIAICEAQGGFRAPTLAPYRHDILASVSGIVSEIDNRRLARLAKLAGAPKASTAGVVCHVNLGETLAHGQPMFTLHAETPGELAYALDYFGQHRDLIRLEPL